MTLAVALKATDAIIVAADSRGTIGDPRGLTAVNDTQQKVFQFGRCAIAMAGASPLALSLLDEFGKRGLNNPQNIDEGVAAFGQAAAIFDAWFRNIAPNQRPSTIFLLAGYRLANGAMPVPLIYVLTSETHFAPQLSNNYPMMVGVPQYAVYLSHRYYDPNMNGDDAAALAEYMISETASQDPKVGGPVRMARVTAEGFRDMTAEEIQRLSERNQELNRNLKNFFNGRDQE